ncbi:MAG: YgfZ/GcvT domain-containing protein [Steroidobacteraceae bacterium]
MNSQLHRTPLTDLGVLRIGGADAGRFLQGQVSNDLERLSPERTLLAGYHSPQGRTIALLRLVAIAEDELLALLPRELVTLVRDRLAKYVLRAKVTLTDVSAEWRISALAPAEHLASGTPAGLAPQGLAAEPGECTRIESRRYLCIGAAPARWLEIAAADQTPSEPSPAACQEWRLLDVRAGFTQVYAATSEHFVAQMLNLDALDAIAFDKGCYTGQEVIARAHYRGRVKRRAQRLRSREPLVLAPGASGVLSDGRAFEVLDSAQLPDGRAEFLAVTALPDAAPVERTEQAEAVRLEVEPLALPYALEP